jgi:hypothetical protein
MPPPIRPSRISLVVPSSGRDSRFFPNFLAREREMASSYLDLNLGLQNLMGGTDRAGIGIDPPGEVQQSTSVSPLLQSVATCLPELRYFLFTTLASSTG